MIAKTVEPILNLLTASIFADKRIYASEITSFIQNASRLEIINELVPDITEAKLLAWYEMNKEAVRKEVRHPYFKDWFYKILDEISAVEDKASILSCMKKISEADGQVHLSERALWVLAANYWQVPGPK